MIENLIFGVYLLFSDFLVESLKANKKKTLILQYSFAQQPHSFYETHSFYEQKYTPATQPKICFWLLLDTQELHSRNTWKSNVCIFL